MLPHPRTAVVCALIPVTLPCRCTVTVTSGGELGRCPAGHDQDYPQHLDRRHGSEHR
ncbi:hypothetical protein [Krasilnikovia sp. MM14-A1004]|uniref:hypothetical protein n=1 Tax=Krasilnikovia sp. MM14-A1004 TaxID=3373541 RepID=UPI00399D4D4D